jgi:hypothetical protein
MKPDEAQVSILDRRIIEIEQAALFVAAMAERWGREAALELLRTVVKQAAEGAARAARRKKPAPTLADLWEVWQHLGGGGRLDLELLESTPRDLRFRVRRCAYAEAYRDLGLQELGLEFSCRRDEPFARAFLPGVAFKQSATIMEGHDGCIFEYSF